MSKIEFFKATSRGGLDPIENSSDSLHYRRSIIIKDDVTETLWVIHGSGAAKKTQKSAWDNVEKINTDNDKIYSIEEIEYDNASEKIESILSGDIKSETPKSASITSIPKIPKVKSTKVEAPVPKGDKETNGPEIKEFQISYFTEEDEQDRVEVKPEIQSELIKDTLVLVSQYIEKLDTIISDRPPKSEAEQILQELSENIISLIYQ